MAFGLPTTAVDSRRKAVLASSVVTQGTLTFPGVSWGHYPAVF